MPSQERMSIPLPVLHKTFTEQSIEKLILLIHRNRLPVHKINLAILKQRHRKLMA